MIKPNDIESQGENEISISSQVLASHIRCLSAVPIDLEKLLQEIEAEEEKNIK
ncbi:MAG: hypothetical protein Q7T03_10790 [Deltaproteobacteria bacterium]|nr:hypothetical protein [Deltaproteobacteria bacterium]